MGLSLELGVQGLELTKGEKVDSQSPMLGLLDYVYGDIDSFTNLSFNGVELRVGQSRIVIGEDVQVIHQDGHGFVESLQMMILVFDYFDKSVVSRDGTM